MIINETLRLYDPLTDLVKEVGREVQLGKLILPANIDLLVPKMALHHNPHLWKDDVHLFKPERFVERIARATKYNSAAYFHCSKISVTPEWMIVGDSMPEVIVD
ncbi:hypothetical protein V6N11_061060 [Hibiscus sabdariffa]|uniref:Uncharacterized protein n=1 Tax=Hibiscus sabdariffa TaxID=183260 RepID=A0ABR2QSR2_9ROSI